MEYQTICVFRVLNFLNLYLYLDSILSSNIAYVMLFTIKVYSLKTDADKLYKRLTHLKQKSDPSKRQRREGCLGLYGRKVDILDHYERRLGDIEDNVRMEQSSAAAKVSNYSCLDIINLQRSRVN